MMEVSWEGPEGVNWDITYACPLRCIHCYSESGRRASKQLNFEQMLKVADAIIAAKPRSVQISGGEPLLVQGLFDLAARFFASGIPLTLYTSGWLFAEPMLSAIDAVFSCVNVSMDGATPRTHDLVRGRNGSFVRALNLVQRLNHYSTERQHSGARAVQFGIDYVIVQSNFHEVELLCQSIVSKLEAMTFLNLFVAVPSGLAGRERFAEAELLTDAQMKIIRDPKFAQHLRARIPSAITLNIFDGQLLAMRPDDIRNGTAATSLAQIEPDGRLRCNAIYEGTVGSLLEEPFETLWDRAVCQRWDPVRVRELSRVTDMQSWSAATRNIDRHYGTAETRDRISRRKEYLQITMPAALAS